MKFSLLLMLTVIGALLAAMLVAPIAAFALAAGGFHFPFPRIFDRTMMVTVFIAMVAAARSLKLRKLVTTGFRDPSRNLPAALRGFATAIIAISTLFILAFILGAHGGHGGARLLVRWPKYILAAIVVALIEETFFRAFMLGGMMPDFGRRGALIVSSAIYALSHLLRSPQHFYLTGYHPAAGLHNLAGSTVQLSHPATALPAVFGLFLLGLVLGEAFLTTGTVYFSIGLHAGFVLAAKSWPAMLTPGVHLPVWLAGYPRFALISGPAAWIVALILLLMVPKLCKQRSSAN
ncbi:MAG: CPBP family intramembrane metalloprotease [Candidatus Binataceae bacterium]|nr:CPBP family intramembrane metalloprotease [Candidatus Binataceae bacterium]